MDTYQIFKIILGLIVSAFIVIFIVIFISNYGGLQTDTQKAKILSLFDKTATNVLLYGNDANFTEFKRMDYSAITFDPISETIITGSVSRKLTEPIFLYPGKTLYIHRGEADLGWWKFYFVEALPDTSIIFNVMDGDAWEQVIDIVTEMPSTTGETIKTRFGLCDGSTLQEDFCNDELCERDYFLQAIYGNEGMTFSRCRETILGEKYRLVFVSDSCTGINEGICIESSPDGVGYIYIDGNQHVYKDVADIIAMIVGYIKSDHFGVYGENLYTLKNEIFRERALFASQVLSSRAKILSSEMTINQCKQLFETLGEKLDEISNILSDEDYYKDIDSAIQFKQLSEEAGRTHREIVNMGCDYPI